jgi:hypothetical protein
MPKKQGLAPKEHEVFLPNHSHYWTPGAGKSTLAKKLANKLNLPIFRIGEFRSKFPLSPIGEADAWVALWGCLSKRKWRNCVLETTGLNVRETFLKVALPFPQRVIVKVEAQRKILYARIGKKRRVEQGGEWLFSTDYRDKYEFVRRLYKEFKKLPSDIMIDTTRLMPEGVFKIALKEIEICKIRYLESI